MPRRTAVCNEYFDFILISGDPCRKVYDARISDCILDFPPGISTLTTYLNVNFLLYNIAESGSQESFTFRRSNVKLAIL